MLLNILILSWLVIPTTQPTYLENSSSAPCSDGSLDQAKLIHAISSFSRKTGSDGPGTNFKANSEGQLFTLSFTPNAIGHHKKPRLAFSIIPIFLLPLLWMAPQVGFPGNQALTRQLASRKFKRRTPMEMGKGEGWALGLKENFYLSLLSIQSRKIFFFHSSIHTTALLVAKWVGFSYQAILWRAIWFWHYLPGVSAHTTRLQMPSQV